MDAIKEAQRLNRNDKACRKTTVDRSKQDKEWVREAFESHGTIMGYATFRAMQESDVFRSKGIEKAVPWAFKHRNLIEPHLVGILRDIEETSKRRSRKPRFWRIFWESYKQYKANGRNLDN